MTPQAKKIVDRFKGIYVEEEYEVNDGDGYFDIMTREKPMDDSIAIQCAIVAVEMQLAEIKSLRKPEYTTFITDQEGGHMDGYERIYYYESILTELKNEL